MTLFKSKSVSLRHIFKICKMGKILQPTSSDFFNLLFLHHSKCLMAKKTQLIHVFPHSIRFAEHYICVYVLPKIEKLTYQGLKRGEFCHFLNCSCGRHFSLYSENIWCCAHESNKLDFYTLMVI